VHLNLYLHDHYRKISNVGSKHGQEISQKTISKLLKYSFNIEKVLTMQGTSNGYNWHQHDLRDENAYLIIFGICIVILLLPFINKLKLGNIEVEVESTGYRPIGTASVAVGFSDKLTDGIRYEFFFARFWY
jgi:hypothetical protein